MSPHPKAEQLNIRTSSLQKAKLAEAARLKNMNVSQFVLNTSLQAADDVLADQRNVQVSAEDYDRFLLKLEAPPQDLPKIRELFSQPSVFES